MLSFFKKIFGSAQDRLLNRYRKIVLQINLQEESYQKLSDGELKAKTEEFKRRFQEGETLDQLLVEAYAVVKNACRRLRGTQIHIFGYDQLWDMVPYDVQLLGAIAMHYGSIAEMQTGEGKTLTAPLPLYLNALSGKPVQLITINDYLAERDCAWVGTILRWLNLTTGYLTNATPLHERAAVYGCDIVYGTASEFGFDYLRDNSMIMRRQEQVQRGHFFALIDEIDSILIDEARTPLIISGPVGVSRQLYEELKEGVFALVLMQRDLSHKLATEGRKVLEKYGYLSEEGEKKISLNKEQQAEVKEAFTKMWLVSKSTPRNKVLKRLKEDPFLREEIDHIEVYYHSEQNKEERFKVLADLFIVVDERLSEYELTDKGIHAWSQVTGGMSDDFVMIDLGEEYAKIDNDRFLTDEQKLQARLALSEKDAKRKERAHNLRQLLRAHLLMEKDVDYIVQDNKIVIIDENTGRPQPGRRFSDGLHQAIEAKESVTIQKETQTYATITLQNYFRMYEKLAGMSGTAITEAGEFKEIYGLEVLCIPPHVPCQRQDFNDEVYMSEREKYTALVKEIQTIHGQGRPILIGTESVEVSEKLSRICRQNRLEHNVLNAKNHAHEAEIIAGAGKQGAITIATNMAGRGTDIKLQPESAKVGGLHVIGTTRHHSRRIDRQLRGRSGRLGDPGSSKFFVSFEDQLMRLFASPRMTAMLKRFRPPEGEPISASILSRSIETAQKRIEQRNYTIRKHTLEYDDVMNKQRGEIYDFRSEVLKTDDIMGIALELLQEVCVGGAEEFCSNPQDDTEWDIEGYLQWLMTHFPVSFDKEFFLDPSFQRETLASVVTQKIMQAFEQKIAHEAGKVQELQRLLPSPMTEENVLDEALRTLIIRKLDRLWQEHLWTMDHLRTEVHLRVVGQKDPLLEFKQEAFALFAQLTGHLRADIAKDLFRFEIVPYGMQRPTPVAPPAVALSRSFLSDLNGRVDEMMAPALSASSEKSKALAPAQPTTTKVGRNDECFCGSGKKYKKCCGAKALAD